MIFAENFMQIVFKIWKYFFSLKVWENILYFNWIIIFCLFCVLFYSIVFLTTDSSLFGYQIFFTSIIINSFFRFNYILGLIFKWVMKSRIQWNVCLKKFKIDFQRTGISSLSFDSHNWSQLSSCLLKMIEYKHWDESEWEETHHYMLSSYKTWI